MSSKPNGLKEVGLKGIGRVFIREGTSDSAVLEQIFQGGILDVMGSKQFAWIKSKYDRQIGTGETPLVIDCGSNIGLSGLFFAFHLPKAHIVCIEPAPDNVELARKNTAGRANIETIAAAVHDQSGNLELADERAEKWAYQIRETSVVTGKTVEAVTINGIMQRHSARRNLIVKIDIEGAEHMLFRSNLEWLDKTDLLIMETHDWMLPGQGTSRNFFRALEGRTFDFLQNAENIFVFFR